MAILRSNASPYAQALDRQGDPLYSSEAPRDFYKTSYSPLATGAATLTGIAAAGGLQYKGAPLWNQYTNALRWLEGYSPGGILSTFQLSTFTSQFANVQPQFFSPEQLRHTSAWSMQLASTIGGPGAYKRLISEGLTVSGGQAFWGKSQETALRHASILTTPGGSRNYIASAYSYSLGVGEEIAKNLDMPLSSYFGLDKLSESTGFPRIPTYNKLPATVIGGQTLGQHIWRQATALGTESVSRFNRLLAAPAGMEPLKTMFSFAQRGAEKLGLNLALDVAEGPGLKMLGALSKKYGLGLGAVVLGYKSLDFATRQFSPLDSTILDEGVTVAGATLITKGQMAVSRVAEMAGMHDYREWQESVAPGSTSLTRLLGFPLATGFVAGIGAFGVESATMARFRKEMPDISVHEAKQLAREHMSTFRGDTLFSKLGRTLTKTSGLYGRTDKIGALVRAIASPDEVGDLAYKFLGKVGPIKLAVGLGAAFGTAIALPFFPGALTPDERPELLARQLAGEEDVAVRRGRFWEFGRCLIKSNTYETVDGEVKTSDEIEVGDYLWGRDADPVEVTEIYKRHHKGSVYLFSVAHDRDIKTGLTGNHIVPVLRDGAIVEIEASKIQVNDYVEVPVRYLPTDTGYIKPSEVIEEPLVLQDRRLFATQRNWFTKQLQKSGTSSIPEIIELDYDLGLLFGYYIAEGNISFNKKNPTVIETVRAKSERWIVDDIVRICNEKFNICPTVRFKTTGSKTKEGCWIVRICSAVLAKFFMYLLYPGKYEAVNKTIPNQFLNGPEDFKQGLIEGYYCGDGHFDGVKVISSARKWLLKLTQLIALNLGSPCDIGPKEENDHSGRWKLRFCHPKATHPGSKFFDGRLFSCVRSIEIQDYNDTVYDFGVDHPDHLFQAGTFLVHNSKWEGDSIAYFRPHWFARLRSRSREKSLWNEAENGELSPLEKWFTKEFTYGLEEMHYKDRPYPMSGTAFEDVPLIGPLLSGTIGRVVKPPRMMHQEELTGPGGSFLAEPLSYGERFALELGQQAPGAPASPFGAEGIIGEQTYRFTEMMGLPGFAATSIKEALTGTSDLFDQMAQFETSRRMYGFEREYWDLELGGLLGATEAFRRLFPHRRRQIPTYNPIRNQMPDWMPGAGQRGIDFLHGDPYAAVPEGEIRLPGEGYAARYPELEGVAPEDYPLIHQFKILGDVAPYSDKYKEIRSRLVAQRSGPNWSEYEEDIYRRVLEQRQAKQKSKAEFYEYQYLSSTGGVFGARDKWGSEGSGDLISELNAINAERRGGKGTVASMLGTYWEVASHNVETPIEYLTPLSPAAKLIHMRSPVEAYKAEEVYGTKNAFWQHPIRDFLRPTKNMFTAALGMSDIPEHIQRKRAIQSYFDVLKYAKYDKLAGMAQRAGDTRALAEFEDKKNETLFGINPYTYDFTSLFRAIPPGEKSYIDSFMNAPTPEVRSEILQLVPENQRGLLTARWQLEYRKDLESAMKSDRLSTAQLEEAKATIRRIGAASQTEGFQTSKELQAEYWATKERDENYADWYRRTRILPKYNLPGPGWVGWNPAVDLEDIKLKLIENVGENMHDYGIYRDRAQKLASKPFIDDAAVDEVLQGLQDPYSDTMALQEIANQVGGRLTRTGTYGTMSIGRLAVNLSQRKSVTSLFGDE